MFIKSNFRFLQRFCWFILGIPFVLTLGEVEGATRAQCKTNTEEWTIVDQRVNLTTCEPDISEVNEEDFTIASQSGESTFAFKIYVEKGVRFLPKNLLNFSELVVVKVTGCSINAVNENHFKSMTKLRKLILYENKIEHISSDAFADLVALEELDLDSNRIRSLGKNTFSSLKTLRKLFISENEIQFLHPKTFGSLANLDHLDLNDNQILQVEESLISSLSNLEKFHILNNNLREIPKTFFQNNLKLEQIRMENNKLESIDAEMFDHLPNLYVVNFKENICVNRIYNLSNFHGMRNDLKQNCTQTIEDLRRQLDKKSKEMVEMRRNFETMLILLRRRIVSNFYISNRRD